MNNNNKLLFCVIFAFAFFMPLLQAAEKTEIGIYVLNLGKFDVSTGSFTADFYLSMKCSSECSEDFEFMNGRATSIDKITDFKDEKFYRILANLNSPVDLRKFPFDRQKMQIILEDKQNTVDDLEYMALKPESGIDSSIAFIGWNIKGWDAEVKEHKYDVYNETYSQYVFSINISRIPLNSFLKTFLPVLFIVTIVIFSYILDPDKIATRLTLQSSGLIAAVMFHVSISNQLPPVGYLTFADKFMILTYFVLIISVILSILILELHELKKIEFAEKVHRAIEYSVFVIIPLIYFLFFAFFI